MKITTEIFDAVLVATVTVVLAAGLINILPHI